MSIVMWETLRGMGEPGAFPCPLLCQVDNSFDPRILTTSTDDPSDLGYIKVLCKEKKNKRKHRKGNREDKFGGPLLSKYPARKDLA